MKGSLLTLLLALFLAGCTAAPSFPEVVGNSTFSQEAFEKGEFRLRLARACICGEYDAWRYYYETEARLPADANLPEAILKALVAKQSGNDAAYYWLGWTAEQMGHYEGAYEYYRMSKLLFDFNRTPEPGESSWDRRWRDADVVYYSPCGREFREPNPRRKVSIPCPDDMNTELNRALVRMEVKLATDL